MENLPHTKQLQYLISLYDHQHFGHAAATCHISQSTLSASITTLESKLGAQLLERDHKTFIFTPLGKEVVRRAREIIEGCQNICELASDYKTPMSGDIHIGCIPTIAPFIMSDLIKFVKAKCPQLKLKLREETTEQGLQSVERGQLDMLILALPYETQQFHTRSLAQDPFLLTLHRDFAIEPFQKDIHFWPDHSLFLLDQEHCLANHTLKACHIKDKSKINPFYASSLYTIKEMINDKQGVSFLPQLAVSSGFLEGSELITVSTMQEKGYRELGMVWRKTSTRYQTFRALGDLLEDIFNNKLSKTNSK